MRCLLCSVTIMRLSGVGYNFVFVLALTTLGFEVQARKLLSQSRDSLGFANTLTDWFCWAVPNACQNSQQHPCHHQIVASRYGGGGGGSISSTVQKQSGFTNWTVEGGGGGGGSFSLTISCTDDNSDSVNAADGDRLPGTQGPEEATHDADWRKPQDDGRASQSDSPGQHAESKHSAEPASNQEQGSGAADWQQWSKPQVQSWQHWSHPDEPAR